MKQLTWKLVLPLTIISFTVFTKWWDVALDEDREIFRGFPLPFVCPGWHTSLSLQIFVLELIVDILVYFLFWFLIIIVVNRKVRSFRISRPVTIILLAISGLSIIILVLLAINPDNSYTFTRPYDIKIIDTGYRFIWQEYTRPDYSK